MSGWGWDSLVEGVASTLKVVEAGIDSVVGIPPNTPLLPPSTVQEPEEAPPARPSSGSLPSLSTPHSSSNTSSASSPAFLPPSASAPSTKTRPSSNHIHSSTSEPDRDAELLQSFLSSPDAIPAADAAPVDPSTDWDSLFSQTRPHTDSQSLPASLQTTEPLSSETIPQSPPHSPPPPPPPSSSSLPSSFHFPLSDETQTTEATEETTIEASPIDVSSLPEDSSSSSSTSSPSTQQAENVESLPSIQAEEAMTTSPSPSPSSPIPPSPFISTPSPSPPPMTAKAVVDQSRVTELEKRVASLTRERDLWKREAQDKAVHAQLEQANERIRLLLMEGEELSKKQLQYENFVKKARAKEREQEMALAQSRSACAQLQQRVDALTAESQQLAEGQKVMASDIGNLQAVNASTASQLEEERGQRLGLEAARKQLQQQLEKAQMELQQWQQSGSAQKQLSDQRLDQMKELFQQRLDDSLMAKQEEAKALESHLVAQLEHLQSQLALHTQSAAEREEDLRRELKLLQERLQASHADNLELHSTMAASAQPFLAQISTLQTALQFSQSTLESLERTAGEETRNARQRASIAEAQLTSLEDGNVKLGRQLESLRSQQTRLEADLESLTIQLQTERSTVAELRNGISGLSGQLRDRNEAMEAMALASDKEKLALLSELSQQRQQAEALKTALSAQMQQQLKSPREEMTAETPQRCASLSVVGVGSGNSVPAMTMQRTLEHLRQREAELLAFRGERDALLADKEQLEGKLISLSRQMHIHEEIQTELDSLRTRHNAALEMIGQKTEQLRDLQSDLTDFKAMHNSQIVELLSKLEQLHQSQS